MSDDGFVDDPYSPYSDFDDIYDAEPGPDLADDLASHALHSPVFADEPGYELLEYHSDWEYYSDDYFDDDPTLLKNNPQEGSPLKAQVPSKRGKKRKLADTADIPGLDLGERSKLVDCIKGTVWAKPALQRENVFQSGNEDKVALLKDWQKRFGTISVQQPSRSKRPRLNADESWANDLSLAEMGLLSEQGNRLEQSGDTQAAEDEDEVEEEDNEHHENGDDEEESATSEAEVEMADEGDPDSQEPNQLHPQKRSRRPHDILPSPPTSTESTLTEKEAPTGPSSEATQELPAPKRGRGRPPKAQSQENTIVTKKQTQQANSTMIEQNKKRKASASPPPEPSVDGPSGTRTIAPRRAKRLASNAIAGLSESKDGSSNAGTRSMRGKKRG